MVRKRSIMCPQMPKHLDSLEDSILQKVVRNQKRLFLGYGGIGQPWMQNKKNRSHLSVWANSNITKCIR